MAEFEARYRECGDAPSAATRNAWVAHSTTQELVVTYTQGVPLRVDGRPKTPVGVAGMGSHSTAWVVECLAADALVSGAGTAPAALEALRRAVRDDLAGDVIKLDRLLPAGQLLGGQMDEIFDTALSVLKAGNVPDAVTGYLTFRNMLPYATVDAGDRAGHGEDVTASETETLDRVALQMAADLEGEARADADRRQESSEALKTVADQLADTDSNPKRGAEPDIKAAVVACAARLRTQSNGQDANPPARDDVSGEIIRTRRDEHADIYQISRISALAARD